VSAEAPQATRVLAIPRERSRGLLGQSPARQRQADAVFWRFARSEVYGSVGDYVAPAASRTPARAHGLGLDRALPQPVSASSGWERAGGRDVRADGSRPWRAGDCPTPTSSSPGEGVRYSSRRGKWNERGGMAAGIPVGASPRAVHACSRAAGVRYRVVTRPGFIHRRDQTVRALIGPARRSCTARHPARGQGAAASRVRGRRAAKLSAGPSEGP